MTTISESSCEKSETVTATQIVVAGSRYNRTDGWARSTSSYSRERLVRPTYELIEKAERRLLLQKLNAATFERCPTYQLRRIVTILNEGTTP